MTLNIKGLRLRTYIYGLMCLGMMILIFCFSAQNGDESANLSNEMLVRIMHPFGIHNDSVIFATDHFLRKTAHVMEYFVLGVVLSLFLLDLQLPRKAAKNAFLTALIYASSDEFHQLFVPGRSGRIVDVLIDGIGFGTAVLAVYLIFILTHTGGDQIHGKSSQIESAGKKVR